MGSKKKTVSLTMPYKGRKREGVSAITPHMGGKKESFRNCVLYGSEKRVLARTPYMGRKRERVSMLAICGREIAEFQSNTHAKQSVT